MRLLIVSQYFWPENFRINDLAVELSKRGHEVVVLTGLPNYPDGYVYSEFKKNPKLFSRFCKVEIVRVPIIPRGKSSFKLILNYISFAINAALIGAWKMKSRKFDVIFVNQLSPVTVGLPGVLLARFKKAKLAMWVLDLWPDSLRAVGVIRSPMLLGLVGLLVRYIYRRCDVILSQSRSFIPIIKRLAGINQKIEYIPSWAENTYCYNLVTPAKEIESNEGLFNIMFAGNIGRSQDFPCILGAAEILRKHYNIRWIIVGDGRMSAWLKNEIETRGLQEQVKLIGRHPLERMPSFFVCADALLVTLVDAPIYAMTIPGKLQSYLTAGLPIVAALNGEGAQLLKTANAGITVSSGDSVGLAEAVLRLSKMSKELRAEMGRNAIKLSCSEFERNSIIDQIEKNLMELYDI